MIDKHISCSCFSDEHTLRFNYNPEEKIENQELYTSIFLNQYKNIFKRIWIAIKYIFGYNCKYGHWDCFVADKDKIKELKEFFKQIPE